MKNLYVISNQTIQPKYKIRKRNLFKASLNYFSSRDKFLMLDGK
jgi:hypothetical protein